MREYTQLKKENETEAKFKKRDGSNSRVEVKYSICQFSKVDIRIFILRCGPNIFFVSTNRPEIHLEIAEKFVESLSVGTLAIFIA